MIVLDTNVVAEAMRPQANPQVIAWLDEQAPQTLYLTATSLAELLLGLALLPVGKRRSTISRQVDEILDTLFGDRVLPFDKQASAAYAILVANARAKGVIISIADAQIAAIAKQHDFIVATRDTAPFKAAGCRVLNPWK